MLEQKTYLLLPVPIPALPVTDGEAPLTLVNTNGGLVCVRRPPEYRPIGLADIERDSSPKIDCVDTGLDVDPFCVYFFCVFGFFGFMWKIDTNNSLDFNLKLYFFYAQKRFLVYLIF